jgi:RNA polymerase sigma-70 factor (ECF subfamily)
MKGLSDSELMKLVIDKNRKALEELYDRYVRLTYSFAVKSTKDEAQARVIVQLVFTRLWTTQKGYDESKGAFVNWLLTITRNCIIVERRKEKRHQDNIHLASDHWEQMKDHAEIHNPEQVVSQQVRKEQIQQAFHWLSENQVQLLQLLYWEGYSLRDIAEFKNESLGTVKSRLHQALKILRRHMVLEGEG